MVGDVENLTTFNWSCMQATRETNIDPDCIDTSDIEGQFILLVLLYKTTTVLCNTNPLPYYVIQTHYRIMLYKPTAVLCYTNPLPYYVIQTNCHIMS